MPRDITDIIAQIDQILENPSKDPVNVIGSRIVGVTIVRQDIESLYVQYPLLEKVAELGAELETISEPSLSDEVIRELSAKFHQLKSQLKNDEFVEKYFEYVILPQYRDESISVAKWIDHGMVGPDNWAHYFENTAGIKFVLLNEDFPDGSYIDDDWTHDIVPAPGGGQDLALQVKVGEAWIPNISGYFTLYKERAR